MSDTQESNRALFLQELMRLLLLSGLNQQQLAERSGLLPTTVSAIFRGVHPGLEVLEKMSKRLLLFLIREERQRIRADYPDWTEREVTTTASARARQWCDDLMVIAGYALPQQRDEALARVAMYHQEPQPKPQRWRKVKQHIDAIEAEIEEPQP